MEMEDLLISTGVDSLIRLVKEKKKIELLMAAQLLGLPQSTVEDWAHILEEEGIIKIDYQLTKVFFIWVPPTAEEITEKKEIFRRRKTQVEQDISKLENIQESGKAELKAYSDAVEKISEKFSRDFARVDELASQIESAKGKKAEVSKASLKKVEEFNSKLSSMEKSLKELESQLRETGKEFGKKKPAKMGGMKESKKHIKELGLKLNELINRVDDLGKKSPKESVDVGNVKSEFGRLRKDFKKVRKESEELTSMIGEFKANADTIKDALSHIKQLSTSAGRARKNLKAEYERFEKLKKELPALEKHIKDDLEVADQYAETIGIAQEVLENVPAKGDILKRLTALENEEKRMSAEFRKMESVLSGVEGSVLSVGDLMEELEEMKSEIEDARTQLSEDAEEVLSSIEEETATYATFQKIKSKTKTSIEAYLAQLAKIRKESARIKEELDEAAKASSERVAALSKSASSAEAKEAMKLMGQLKEKKEELAKIRTLISDLHSRSSMIEKNIKLLSKEAKLIALREGSAPSAKAGKEVKERVSLTSEEQEEFEHKRKELKSLIRKLWESD
jgi:chromosome segregation ATPase